MIVLSEVLSAASKATERRLGTIFACELIMFAVLAPLIGLLLALQAAISDELVMYVASGAMAVFVIAPLSILLNLGFYRILLAAYRGEKTSVAALFGEWKLLMPGLMEFILFETGSRFVMIPLLVPALLAWLQGERAVLLMCLIACVIPYGWFWVCYSLSVPFLVDRKLGGFAALQASFQATRGHRWHVFKVVLTCALLMFLGALMCGLGLLYTLPYASLMLVDVYEKLSKSLSTCPLCQERIPLDRERCPACDEWIPSRVLPATRCRHCDERVAPGAGCPFCAQPDPVEQEASTPSPERWSLHVDARRPSRWLAGVGLVFAVPFILQDDDPSNAYYWTTAFLARFSALPSWLGVTLTVGVQVLPILAAVLIIIVRARASRACDADEAGAAFGRTSLWRGFEVPWDRVEGFRITGAGVMLKLVGDPLSRWWGPTLRLGERDVHDLVVRLEERGILNLAG